MASTDWNTLTDGLATASLVRGVTGSPTPPNGGGSFIYGMRSVVAVTGAAGLYTAQADYAPIVAGAGGPPVSVGGVSIRGAIMRGTSLAEGFAPMFFVALQGASVNDEGYIIGLEDTAPHRVVVRKGRVVDGVPMATSLNSLLRSQETKNLGEWWHIRLDQIVNLAGDVVLRAYENDLSTYPVSAPVWEEMEMDGANDGVGGFIDDALGANSGSLPYDSGGYVGFGMQVSQLTRRGYWDHIEIARQI